jgi:glutathione peroxidase
MIFKISAEIFFNCSQLEPGTPAEIMNAVQYVRPGGGFLPDFPLFAKSEINGANRLPLYAWLTVNPSLNY